MVAAFAEAVGDAGKFTFTTTGVNADAHGVDIWVMVTKPCPVLIPPTFTGFAQLL